MYNNYPFMNDLGGCGCNMCPNSAPTSCNYQNVVNKYNVETVPHYENYHTHVVNSCIKKHITIPKYSTSEETVLIDEYAGQAQPMYEATAYMPTSYVQQGPMYNQMPIYTQGCCNQGQMYAQGPIYNNGAIYDQGAIYNNGPIYDHGPIYNTGPIYDQGPIYNTGPIYEGVYPQQKVGKNHNGSPIY